MVYARGGGALADEMLLQRRADFALPRLPRGCALEETVGLMMRKIAPATTWT